MILFLQLQCFVLGGLWFFLAIPYVMQDLSSLTRD